MQQFYGELLWQYHAIERRTLEKIQDAHTTLRSQKTHPLALIAQNRASRTEFVLIVVSMQDVR